jgi:hypothetical protein
VTATQHVWPGLDRNGNSLTVYAKDEVTLIPAAGGAIVPWVKYYEDLVNAFTLRTSDPLDLGGDPITLPPDGGDSRALSEVLTSELHLLTGLSGGELFQTAGREYPGDGGHEWFRFFLGVSAGENGVDRINCATGQFALQRYGMVAAARSTGIKGNGSSDDTAGFENWLERFAKQGAVREEEPGLPNTGPVLMLEPSDRVRLTDTIVLDPSVHCADVSIVGGRARSTNDFGAVIYWDSANTTKPMFSWGTRGGLFQGVFLAPNSGRDLLCAINWRVRAGAYGPGTALKVRDCNIRPFSDGVLQYGVVTDIDDASPQNMEDAEFYDVYWSALEAAVWLKNGQPYNTSFVKCLFEAHSLALPTGRGVWIAQGSTSVFLKDCIFGRLSTGVALDDHGPVKLDGFDSERTKRLIGQGNGSLVSNSRSAGAPITLIGGRVAANSYGLAANNPTIAAEEDTWLHAPFGLDALTMQGVNFLSSAEALPRWKIKLGSRASMIAIGCTLPNTDPVVPGAVDAPAKVVWIGCKGRNSFVTGSPVDLYDEMHSPGGTRTKDVVTIVIPDPFTTVNVPWTRDETARPLVIAEVSAESGTPSAGSLTRPVLSSISSTGCVVTLGAAPGAGASVRVDLVLRDPAAVVEGMIGELSYTSASTVRGTASGEGLRDYKWLAVLVHMNAVPNGNQVITNCVNGANGWQLYGNGNGVTGSVFVSNYSGAGNTNTPTIALSSVDVGKTHLYVFTRDATTVRAYKARAEVGSGAAHTPAAAAAGTRHLFGVNNGGTEPVTTDWTILQVAGSDTGTTPTLLDVQTYFDAVAAARKLVLFPGSITTEHLWSMDGGATVDDEVGSDDVTLVSGAAPGTALVVPDFPWVT